MVNKQEIINMVTENTCINKDDTVKIIETLFDTMLEQLANGQEVKIAGFGKFEVKDRKARKVINPNTKEKIDLPKQKAITFKASKQAKDLINK